METTIANKIKSVACTLSGMCGRFAISGEYVYDTKQGITAARINLTTQQYGSLCVVENGERKMSVPQGEDFAEVVTAFNALLEEIDSRAEGILNN